MKLTFVDAGVLIAAARGGSEQAARAMEVLDDPEREFAASPFLRLEVIPQATFNKRLAEVVRSWRGGLLRSTRWSKRRATCLTPCRARNWSSASRRWATSDRAGLELRQTTAGLPDPKDCIGTVAGTAPVSCGRYVERPR